jgi:hypothetical protein
MRGRIMYVVPFSMGPIGSPFSKLGVQVTDSPYVVANLRIMTRMGTDALRAHQGLGRVGPAVHSVGAPLARGSRMSRGRATPPNTSATSPRPARSGRSAPPTAATPSSPRSRSRCASPPSWLATRAGSPSTCWSCGSPTRRVVQMHVAAAFPSACGKTNFAMLTPTIPGWTVETIGDDIAWLRQGPDGRLRAINPRLASSASHPAPARKPTPMRSTCCGATRSSPTSPCARTVTSGGRVSRRRRRRPHRLARRAVEPELGHPGRASELAFHCRCCPVPVHLGRLAASRRRRHRRNNLRRPPCLQRALGGRGARLGSWCLPGRHDLFGANGGR